MSDTNHLRTRIVSVLGGAYLHKQNSPCVLLLTVFGCKDSLQLLICALASFVLLLMPWVLYAWCYIVLLHLMLAIHTQCDHDDKQHKHRATTLLVPPFCAV